MSNDNNQKDKVFDPAPYLINLESNSRKPDRLYLEAKFRAMWMRTPGSEKEINLRFGIQTELLEHNYGKHATFKATIIDNESGRVLATGHKTEVPTKRVPDYLEKSETGSIARALGMCGFGTQFALEFQGEGHNDRPVDGPMAGNGKTAPPPDSQSETPKHCTKAQANVILDLMKQKGIDKEAFIEEFGSLKAMTFDRAGAVIELLQSRPIPKPENNTTEIDDDQIPFADHATQMDGEMKEDTEIGEDGKPLL